MKQLHRFIILVIILALPTISLFAQDDQNTDSSYVIKIGESIGEIALNLNVDVDCLMVANAITNPSFITPGDVLLVPAECSLNATATDAVPDEVVEDTTDDTPPDETIPVTIDEDQADVTGIIYVVSANQTLTDIAFELLIDLNCLIETNNIDNISEINEGDELIIADECSLIGGTSDETTPDEETTDNAVDDETMADTSDDDAETSEEAVPLGETVEDDENDTDDNDTVVETDTTTETSVPADENIPDDDNSTVPDEDTVSDESIGQGGGEVDTTVSDTSTIPLGEYTVRYGDTLARIANNANTTVSCLLSTNRNISNADLIYAGQVITISASCVSDGQGGGGNATSTITDDARTCRGDRNPGRTTNNGRYIVQAGDMLDFIGCDFGLQTACLAEVNDLSPPGAIEIGQSLIIDFSCPAWDGPPGPGDLDN